MTTPNSSTLSPNAQASTPTRHAPRKWGARRPNTPDVAMMANAKSGACAGCGRETLLGTDDLCLSCTLNTPRPTREPQATGHSYETAQRIARRENIRLLLDVTGLDPVAALDLILTNDGALRNWREAVAQ